MNNDKITEMAEEYWKTLADVIGLNTDWYRIEWQYPATYMSKEVIDIRIAKPNVSILIQDVFWKNYKVISHGEITVKINQRGV